MTGANMNLVLIWGYIEEFIALTTGQESVTLIKDVLRAFNDFRAGKLTVDEFTLILDDLKAVAIKLFTPKPVA